jgi:hypothetical protein
MFSAEIEPGRFVRLPARPDWGRGQVQSAIGTRVTVNFEHAGKILVNTATAVLELDEPETPGLRS